MATISTLYKSGATHQANASNRVKTPYLAEVFIDFADAATAKGSALAAADVIEAIYVPAGTIVLTGGIQVVEAATGESADVALDLGVTGVDADVWVDGFDLDAAVAGDFAQNPAAFQPVVVGAAADTVDVLIQAATTAPTGGVIRVFAVLCDAANSPVGPAGIAQVGS